MERVARAVAAAERSLCMASRQARVRSHAHRRNTQTNSSFLAARLERESKPTNRPKGDFGNSASSLLLTIFIDILLHMDDLIIKTDIQHIADEGKKIYEEVRLQYDPEQKGKFLAIDIDTKNVYLGDTSAEAVNQARVAHPNKVFYVVKIGFDVVETMANFLKLT